MDDFRIRDLEHLTSLWRDIYSETGKVDWGRMLPFYSDDIVFRDSIQEIRGKAKFVEMTQRLARRSRNLTFLVHNGIMEGDLAFVEWEMVISYKNYPTSSVYGASRLLLRDGKVVQQRDYYDLWGDIFDNIPFLSKVYRRFMKGRFG
jgi:ketosteroid isomerase-like protein